MLGLQKARFFEKMSAKYWNIATRQSCPITDDSQVRPGHSIHCVQCQALEYCHQTELSNHRRQPGETRSQDTLCTVPNIGILPPDRADQSQTTARWDQVTVYTVYSAKHWNIATRQSWPITNDSQALTGLCVIDNLTQCCYILTLFKGAVSRDFRSLYFFINRTHLGPW